MHTFLLRSKIGGTKRALNRPKTVISWTNWISIGPRRSDFFGIFGFEQFP